MPIARDFLCKDCESTFEDLVMPGVAVLCPECSSDSVVTKPVATAGYKIKGDNGASITPKGSAAFKRVKQC